MSAKRICRVCGKEYEACHTLAPMINTFRWQEVACSPECGAIYLRDVLRARGELPKDHSEGVPDGIVSSGSNKNTKTKRGAKR